MNHMKSKPQFWFGLGASVFVCLNTHAQLRFEPLIFEANRPKLSLVGGSTSNVVIETSINLTNWSFLYSAAPTNGRVDFLHSGGSADKAFYRAYTTPSVPVHVVRNVTPSFDTKATVSTLVTMAGGSCVLFLENDARITLTFPPNTIATPQYVTMTRVTNLVGMPFARGILGAVRIEPGNLSLFGAASLEVSFGRTNLDRRQVVSFASNGDGTHFRLTPDNVRTNSATLAPTTAGIFGSCLATPQELDEMLHPKAAKEHGVLSLRAPRNADSPDDDGSGYLTASRLCFPDRIRESETIKAQLIEELEVVSERVAASRDEARQNQPAGAADDLPLTADVGIEACIFYTDKIRPLFPRVENNCSLLTVLAGITLGIARQVELLGYTDCLPLGQLSDLPLCQGARACFDEIKQCCHDEPTKRDSFAIDLMGIIRQEALLGIENETGCFELGDDEVQNLFKDCSELEWTGWVRVTEQGNVEEEDQFYFRSRVLSTEFNASVNQVTPFGPSAFLTLSGQLSHSDKTINIDKKTCPDPFPGIHSDCGPVLSVNQSSAFGKQDAQVLLGINVIGTNATYTINIGGGGVSAPSRRAHYGDAIRNCNTCAKEHFSDGNESSSGGTFPSLIIYQGILQDTNVVSGGTNMTGMFDPLGPSEISFKWYFSRKIHQ